MGALQRAQWQLQAHSRDIHNGGTRLLVQGRRRVYILFMDNPLSRVQRPKTRIVSGRSGNAEREIRGPRNFRRYRHVYSRGMAEEVLQRYDRKRLQQEDTNWVQHAIWSTQS